MTTLRHRHGTDGFHAGARSALLADDDDDTRTLLAASLRRAGFHVFEASDGEQLLEQYSSLRAQACTGPTVVVSDIGMPGCDGIAATQALRNDSFVPIIILVTAFSDDETLRSARSAGADIVLCKPVDGAALVAVIRDLTRDDVDVR
jgi:DNA-binding response OmpR family regulator